MSVRIGILGAGQLGMMLAEAGRGLDPRLDVRFRFLDRAADAPAARFGQYLVGDYEDQEMLELFAHKLDRATYEFENVPLEAALWLAQHLPLDPAPEALRVAQDRLVEKTFLNAHGLPTPRFHAVDTRADLEAAVAAVGLPAVLKTRRFGYDGKGQHVLRDAASTDAAWEVLRGRPLLLEERVAFDREVSLVTARSRRGDFVFYPLVENHHEKGILRWSLAPAPGVSPALQEAAEAHARRLMEALGYVGVLTIELFVVGDRLLGNEIAPRVHNSGHWTIEGAATSQFENHLRALVDEPLGAATARGTFVMLNVLGREPEASLAAEVAGVHVHPYGKAPRPGRKLGHWTFPAPSPEEARERVAALLADPRFHGRA